MNSPDTSPTFLLTNVAPVAQPHHWAAWFSIPLTPEVPNGSAWTWVDGVLTAQNGAGPKTNATKEQMQSPQVPTLDLSFSLLKGTPESEDEVPAEPEIVECVLIAERPPPEFVWSEAIYKARKAAEEFSRETHADY